MALRGFFSCSDQLPEPSGSPLNFHDFSHFLFLSPSSAPAASPNAERRQTCGLKQRDWILLMHSVAHAHCCAPRLWGLVGVRPPSRPRSSWLKLWSPSYGTYLWCNLLPRMSHMAWFLGENKLVGITALLILFPGGWADCSRAYFQVCLSHSLLIDSR